MLIDSNKLAEWCGHKNASKVRQWLNSNGIPWTADSDGKPVTTLDAVTHALEKNKDGDEVEFADG